MGLGEVKLRYGSNKTLSWRNARESARKANF